MVMQLLQKLKNIFELENTGLVVKTYEIIITSVDSGIIEFCQDTISLDGLKKSMPNQKTLSGIYERIFQDEFEEA
jgi:phosphatidylinositol 4-kinase